MAKKITNADGGPTGTWGFEARKLKAPKAVAKKAAPKKAAKKAAPKKAAKKAAKGKKK